MRRAGQQHIGHDVGQLAGGLLVEAALRDPRRSQTDSGRITRILIARDGVAVDHDPDDIQNAGCLVAAEGSAILACDRGDIHVHQVAVGAAERDAQAALLELVGHGLGVFDRLFLQFFELPGLGQLEGQGQRGEHVDVWSALLAGEDGAVDLFRDGRVGGQQHGTAWTVEALMRGGHDHMGDPHRRRHHACRDQPADVRDIGQEVGAHFIGDLAELLPIGDPGIGRVSGDQQFWSGFECLDADLFVVQPLVLVHGVMDGFEPFPRAVDRRAVREMPAVQKVKSHDGFAQWDQRLVDRVVGRRAGEGLHVDVDLVRSEAVGGERLGSAAAGQCLDHIGVFDALVVARVAIAAIVAQTGRIIQDLFLGHPARVLFGIAFGIDVLEGRAECLAHSHRRR